MSGIKFLLFFLIIFLSTDAPRFIKGDGFSGYIFDRNHLVLLSLKDQNDRYTPSNNDIILAEKILKDKIEQSNLNLSNQTSGCPIISKNLKKYIRQYVGFKNPQGQKTIWVNLLWKQTNTNDQVKKEIITVSDGCSYYWNVKINIDKNTVYDLTINGKA
ncbi:MAG: hypothetical protein EOO45_11745 [Flavobacterium sp.]|nr:MAG: hypothetical protein EOO45_11745 [Flavobacterium sp.]